MCNVTRKHLHQLFTQVAYTHLHIFTTDLQIAFSQPVNLLRSLSSKTSFSVTKCDRSKCLTCNNIILYKNSITINDKPILLNKDLNCSSTDILYVMFCSCGQRYIGETSTSLSQRMNGHRFHIRHQNTPNACPADFHIAACGGAFAVAPIYYIACVRRCKCIEKFLQSFPQYLYLPTTFHSIQSNVMHGARLFFTFKLGCNVGRTTMLSILYWWSVYDGHHDP